MNFVELNNQESFDNESQQQDRPKNREISLTLVTDLFFTIFKNVTRESKWTDISHTLDNKVTIEFRRKMLRYVPIIQLQELLLKDRVIDLDEKIIIRLYWWYQNESSWRVFNSGRNDHLFYFIISTAIQLIGSALYIKVESSGVANVLLSASITLSSIVNLCTLFSYMIHLGYYSALDISVGQIVFQLIGVSFYILCTMSYIIVNIVIGSEY